MKKLPINWKLVRRITGLAAVVLLFLVMFVSDRFVYFSHERFGVLADLQLNRRTALQAQHSPPLIIGHRGSGLESLDFEKNKRRIGNTRAAITAAIPHADWLEIDVRKTSDSPPELVVFHDAKLSRDTTGSPESVEEKRVEKKKLQQLKELALRVPEFEGRSEKILTLNEVLGEFDSADRHWIIDIKSTGIRQEVLDVLSSHDLTPARVILFGDHHVLQEYRDTEYPRGYTALAKTHRNMLYSYSSVLQRCKDESYDYLVVPAVFVTLELGADCAVRNLPLWSYDSNDVRDLDYAVGCGVRGLIVDDPEDVKKHFDKGSE